MIGGFINESTRESANLPFPIETYFSKFKLGERENPFCFAIVTKVEAVTRVEKEFKLRDGVTLKEGEVPTADQVQPESRRYLLVFSFQNPKDTNIVYTEEVWDIKAGDTKKEIKERMLGDRVSFLWHGISGQGKENLYAPALLKRLGKEAFETIGDWFTAVAMQFNTFGVEKKPVYVSEDGPILYQMKLVRRGAAAGKSANQLQFPLNGNIVEKYIKGAPSSLIVTADDIYELIETKAAVNLAAAPGSVGSGVPGSAKAVTKQEWPTDI